jgi:hypothetical protein
MNETEPLLFGLFIDDWKNLASIFVAPAIGLSAAYLLGADLLKVPFVATDVPYKIPRRMLALLAIVLCFAASLTNACWLTLRTYSGPNPSVDEFLLTFFRPLETTEKDWLIKIGGEPVVDAVLSIDEFDVRSDLRVFVNNVRVFGSYQDCIWTFQCRNEDRSKEKNDFAEFLKARKEPILNETLYPPDKLNKLGEPISLLSSLRSGLNYIDVFSNNSGLTGCHIKGLLAFTMLSGKVNTIVFNIDDGARTGDPFRTIRQSGTYRTCDQFRLPANIHLGGSR